ncbi:GTPase [Limnofasciculus baicalensis]|uniref:50S ribosome-binding GTPase n=1 Tax=Limnofasciculus baicalensis BBK-W-15 TaxID=2699891 RepID=A0AAE3GTC8_9CYAN|nr:GTPase [Limnofasciculus baicalensis]MCP2730385.1 50S ribosome-binding GTPase [Limnofasciculus baicalensis BBK-W-15]
MMPDNPKFEAAAVGKRFTNNCIKLDKLLAQNNSKKLLSIRQRMRNELRLYHDSGLLSVAFIGQYSAGKSTIISALTGRRDIAIDSDLTTDKTTDYDWNGIKLIDTPGLFTERQDHDDITYNAIAKSDLLVFCLTSMLFDSITVANFKQLAYEKGYRWKMMLVINKMSDEAGDDEQKIINYRHSLAEALHPYSLDEFPICFIDGKDYYEGIDTKDDFLIEVSRFATFIEKINIFVKYRGYLTRFDTPIRIALGCLDEAQLSIRSNSHQDSAFWEILTRLSRTVTKERDRFRTKIQGIILKMSSAIAKEGIILATSVGSDTDFEQLNQHAHFNIEKYYQEAGEKIVAAVSQSVASIKQQIEQLVQSNLVQIFIASQYNIKSAQNVGANLDSQRIQAQINWLNEIGKTAGVNLTSLGREKIPESQHSPQMVGKFLDFQLKPWRLVTLPKTISYHLYEDSTMNLSEITSQFNGIAKHLEYQIKLQLREFEGQIYNEIEQKIAEARQEEENAIVASNTWLKQLAFLRKDFNLILRYITTTTDIAVAFVG